MDKLTRRNLLQRTAIAGTTVLFFSPWFSGKAVIAQTNSLQPESGDAQGFSYFTAPEIAFLNAAVSRLVPADSLGLGAREAGGVFFIDQQMASPYGRAERWYMQGPWKEGTKEQGYRFDREDRNCWANA